MEKIRRILEKKIIIFLIQFIILSIIIYSSGYYFIISFDSGIIIERQLIIQFLANYVMFEGVEQLIFLVCIWIVIALIPVFLIKRYWKSITMNLTTFILPNFFFYVFISRYSTNYFSSNIQLLILKSISLGLIIVMISLSATFILKKIGKSEKTSIYKDLEQIKFNAWHKCDNCGTEFSSVPKYCYNCLNKIIKEKNIIE